MNFLVDAIMTLLTYEAIQEKWTERLQLQHQGWKDMASGAVAGGVGSFLTNPMDVGEFFFLSANVFLCQSESFANFCSKLRALLLIYYQPFLQNLSK